MNTIEDGFLQNLVDLIDLMSQILDNYKISNSILELGKLYIKTSKKENLIHNFITYSKINWNNFDENIIESLLEMFPNTEDTEKLKKLKNIISEEEKSGILEYILELVRTSIVYIHQKRKWGKVNEEKYGYTAVYFKEISVKKYAEKFSVTIQYEN